MKSITPHDCRMALLPPAALVINENGIVFNEMATMQLALTENSLFKINIDGSQLYFEETTSTDFFRVFGLIDTEKAFCHMPGLFEYIGLKEPSVYLINPIKEGMRKLIFDKTQQEIALPDDHTGTSVHCCDPSMADGMHDDTTDGGISHIIMSNEFQSLYVANETVELDDVFAPLPDIYSEPTTTAAPQADTTQNPAPKKKRGPKPGFKRAKVTDPAPKKVKKTRKNAKAV